MLYVDPNGKEVSTKVMTSSDWRHCFWPWNWELITLMLSLRLVLYQNIKDLRFN